VTFSVIGLMGFPVIWLGCSLIGAKPNGLVAAVALWMAILFVFEGIWDRFVFDREWIELEPRSLPLPANLRWLKGVLPFTAFAVGILGGHWLWY